MNSTAEGRKSLRFKAVLHCDGLCKDCFDARAEKWSDRVEEVFQDVFEKDKVQA